jgi:hypothetical protein
VNLTHGAVDSCLHRHRRRPYLEEADDFVLAHLAPESSERGRVGFRAKSHDADAGREHLAEQGASGCGPLAERRLAAARELNSCSPDLQDQLVQAEFLERIRERHELLGAESHGRILANAHPVRRESVIRC